MKRVTNKTAVNIYKRWMMICAEEYDFVLGNAALKEASLDDLAKIDKDLLKLNFVLNDYTDNQLKKVITRLENYTCWEATYLNGILLHLLKSNLRERKLNKIL